MLDLATVSEGSTSAAAVADTTTLARRADELGYRRFWVAEHHNMATVASTATGVDRAPGGRHVPHPGGVGG